MHPDRSAQPQPQAAPRKGHDASPRIKQQQQQQQRQERSALVQLEANTLEQRQARDKRLSIVSEGSEGDELSAQSPQVSRDRPATSRPAKARLSGSETDLRPQAPQAALRGGVIVAEQDMQKLLPGQLRGFRQSPAQRDDVQDQGLLRGSRQSPAQHDDAQDQGLLSARTLLSGKSTARAGVIDDGSEVIWHTHDTDSRNFLQGSFVDKL